MASTSDLLVDAFERIREAVGSTVSGLSPEQLRYRVDPEANSVAWLVWHLTRVQDDHVAEVAGTEQVWTAGGWEPRFGLPFAPEVIGYGQSSADVAEVEASAELLTGYHDAVSEASQRYVKSLDDAALDRVVDERWDPPVTLAVRLVSVVQDDLMHIGQAAFVRGVVQRG